MNTGVRASGFCLKSPAVFLAIVVVLNTISVGPAEGKSGAVIIDGGDRDEHGSFDGAMNHDGWKYIEEMLRFALTGSSNGAPHDILVIGTRVGKIARQAVVSAHSQLPSVDPLTFVTGMADVMGVDFDEFKVIYVPSRDSHVDGGVTGPELSALTARKLELMWFVNSGGSLVALTQEGPGAYEWLALPEPFTIEPTGFGFDPPATGTNRQYPTDPFVAALAITPAQLNAATPLHNAFTGPPGFNGLRPFVYNYGLNGTYEDETGDDQVVALGLTPGEPLGECNYEPEKLGDWYATGTGHYPVPTATGPNGKRYAGRFFHDEQITLDATDLGTHQHVRVAFKLYIIGRWRGSGVPDLPDGDYWSFTAETDSGPLHFNTTFSNEPDFQQNFPDSAPGPQHAARTDAFAINELQTELVPDFPADTSYCMEFDFPHQVNTLRLVFTANVTNGSGSWGLDDVCIRTINRDTNGDGMVDFRDPLTIFGEGRRPGGAFTDCESEPGFEIAFRQVQPAPEPVGDPRDFVAHIACPNDSVAELRYDPNTGEVLLKPDGSVVNAFAIYSSGEFLDDRFVPVFGREFVAATPFELATFDGTFTGLTAQTSLGQILPPGLTETEFVDLFVDAQYVGTRTRGGQLQLGLVSQRIACPVLTDLNVEMNPLSEETTVTGTVALSDPAPRAGVGGVLVYLQSDNPLASVPPSVIVPVGKTMQSFPISVHLVHQAQWEKELREVLIWASYGGDVKTVLLTVVDGLFIRGDANANGAKDLSDAIFIFNFLFLGGPPPVCGDAADTNDQGEVNISSGVFLLSFLFLGGPKPPPPWPVCGPDPTDDKVDCAEYNSC